MNVVARGFFHTDKTDRRISRVSFYPKSDNCKDYLSHKKNRKRHSLIHIHYISPEESFSQLFK